MICTLCLAEIEKEDPVTIKDSNGNEKNRHQKCHNKLEQIVKDLDKIYQEDNEG
jgi:hypothetical protein